MVGCYAQSPIAFGNSSVSHCQHELDVLACPGLPFRDNRRARLLGPKDSTFFSVADSQLSSGPFWMVPKNFAQQRAEGGAQNFLDNNFFLT